MSTVDLARVALAKVGHYWEGTSEHAILSAALDDLERLQHPFNHTPAAELASARDRMAWLTLERDALRAENAKLKAALEQHKRAAVWAHNELTRNGYFCNGDCLLCEALGRKP